MRRALILILFFGLGVGLAWGADLTRKAHVGRVAMDGALPPDLVRPEGSSRWDLTALARPDRMTVSLETEGNAVTRVVE